MRSAAGLLWVFCLGGCKNDAAIPPPCRNLCVAPSLSRLELLAGQPGGPGWVDGKGSVAHFSDPAALTGTGDTLFLLDGNTVRSIDRIQNEILTLGGTYGARGGDDGIGASARFDTPYGIAATSDAIYISDTENHSIRKLNLSDRSVTTFAGVYNVPGSSDGIGSDARLREPEGLAIDLRHPNNLYVADTDNHVIRRIDLSTRQVTTVIGTTGTAGASDGVGAAARFSRPRAVAMDSDGVLFVLESGNNAVRRVSLDDGTVTTLHTFDTFPRSVAILGAELVVALSDHRLVTLAKTGGPMNALSTLVGAQNIDGFVDGSATEARLFNPNGLWRVGDTLYIADGNYALRALDLTSHTVTTLLGANPIGSRDGIAGEARFRVPQAVAIAKEVAYVSDTGNHTLRQVALGTGAVTTLAGMAGMPGNQDGLGSEALFNQPAGLIVDNQLVYIADSGNQTLRQFDVATGQVSTLPFFPAQDLNGLVAPAGLALDRDSRTLYIGDAGSHLVLTLDLGTGKLASLAGSEAEAGAVDGKGSVARFSSPRGLALDERGNLYVADVLNNAIRKIVLSTGEVSTLAGSLGIRGTADGTSARLAYPTQLALTTPSGKAGELWITDSLSHTIRRLDLEDGSVTTPIGQPTIAGVRLGALPAQLTNPTALAFTQAGQLVLFSESALLYGH